MIIRTGTQACLAAGFLAMALPSGAVSLASTGAAPPLPASSVQALAVAATEDVSTGSSALVPLMATDAPTTTPPLATVDIPAESNASPLGKPLDDVQFVKRATESGRVETSAALGAISQLDTPRLREVAESLAADRTEANDRLSMIAESKGWPIPDIRAADTPPAGSSSTDFDARWIADMVAGNERAAALYRAQAQGGEDPDLRKYALDTLPTIERHLAELRSLQK
jgi:predicted outer membrane protein